MKTDGRETVGRAIKESVIEPLKRPPNQPRDQVWHVNLFSQNKKKPF